MNSSMKILGSVLLAGSIAAYAADDCGVPKPVRPFEGLIDQANIKQGDASVIADVSSKRVALIVSPNADKQLAWNESLRQPLTGFQGFVAGALGTKDQWEQANADTYDPKVILNRITAPFLAAAKQVKSMADLAEFRDSGFELAIVLDINFKCSNNRNFWGATDSNNEIEIVAYPLSPTFVLGPAVYGRSKFRSKYEPGHPEVARWRQDAVNLRIAAARDFETNVARAYPGAKAASQAAGGEAAKSGARESRSAQTRLEAVEDLRKRGLISDKEAEAKRQEILKSL